MEFDEWRTNMARLFITPREMNFITPDEDTSCWSHRDWLDFIEEETEYINSEWAMKHIKFRTLSDWANWEIEDVTYSNPNHLLLGLLEELEEQLTPFGPSALTFNPEDCH